MPANSSMRTRWPPCTRIRSVPSGILSIRAIVPATPDPVDVVRPRLLDLGVLAGDHHQHAVPRERVVHQLRPSAPARRRAASSCSGTPPSPAAAAPAAAQAGADRRRVAESSRGRPGRPRSLPRLVALCGRRAVDRDLAALARERRAGSRRAGCRPRRWRAPRPRPPRRRAGSRAGTARSRSRSAGRRGPRRRAPCAPR